jgi:hypothetical protein
MKEAKQEDRFKLLYAISKIDENFRGVKSNLIRLGAFIEPDKIEEEYLPTINKLLKLAEEMEALWHLSNKMLTPDDTFEEVNAFEDYYQNREKEGDV